MIKEKMLELLVLDLILSKVFNKSIEVYGKKYNTQKILERTNVLLEEFLEPYVIESDSKE